MCHLNTPLHVNPCIMNINETTNSASELGRQPSNWKHVLTLAVIYSSNSCLLNSDSSYVQDTDSQRSTDTRSHPN
jgi:hypothetical protein